MQNEMVFIIADISGYTKYMIDNEAALVHSQGIISELLNAVIKQVQIPIRIAKFEGDAVFLFAEKRIEKAWEKNGKMIGEKLYQFMAAFDAKLNALLSINSCPCGGCKNMHLLRLKIITHKGVALKYKIGKFSELSGKDVIVVHRLLKNSIPSNKYILLSQEAQNFLKVKGEFAKGIEKYDDVGEIPILFQSFSEKELISILHEKNLKDILLKKKWNLKYSLKTIFREKSVEVK